MMRALMLGLAISALAGLCGGTSPAFAQSGYDRPGGDYTSFTVANGDPAACATRCEHDKVCRAWSFAYPPEQGGEATCWLKREVAPRVQSSCCVSGVRGAGVMEPRSGEIEYSIDRAGGDYRWFETTPDPKGKACAEACHAEAKCRAWTYRRPGYGAPVARCFLKEAIKPPHPRPCCISGVVR
jgi:hypothetical protein